MVLKSLWLLFVVICLVANKIQSWKTEEYLSTVEEILLNPILLAEYEKNALKLFSDPDYAYGKAPGAFPCQLNINRTRNDPLTVHNLRPNDIQCVAAIGDSLTAGLGAQATTPIGLVTEWRGYFI